MAANDAVSMNVAENRKNVPMAIQENRAAVPMTVAEGGGTPGGLNRKADKVTGAVAGNLAGLDANGNLTDSGKAPGDFLEAPATAGSEGQVLTADGEGGASWQDPTGGDPTEIIDDTAGSGDTDKVWSADKSHELLTEITNKADKTELTKSNIAILENHNSTKDIDFTWTSGYITTEGGTHARTNRYQYYSQLIPWNSFRKIELYVGQGIQVCAAYYDRDTGSFVSRDADWTTTKKEIFNTYSVVLMIALVNNSSTEVTAEEIEVRVGIKIDKPDVFGDVLNLTWSDGYIDASGNVDSRQTYNNYYSNLIDGFTFSKIIINPSTERQFTIAYFDKVTGAFVSRSNYFTVYTTVDNRYSVIISIATTKKTSAIGSKTVDEVLDEIGIRIEGSPLFRWTGAKVAFIGDSITAGTGTDSDNIYYKLINNLVGFSNVYADGVAGSCYSSQSNYGTTIEPIINRIDSIPNDRDLIVIFAGTNDWGHNTPLGTIADITDVSFYGALNAVISGILEDNPKARLVLMTPLHRWGFGDYQEDTGNNGQGLPLKAYVDAIKASAEMFGVPVIDMFSESCLNPRITAIKTAYVPDGLHPNATGHRIISRRIVPKLQNL